MKFRDRTEAGRLLGERLVHLKDERPVVLALPRGGVPVGFEIARTLGAPLDVMVVRKLGAPGQPELAMGAVVDGQSPEIVTNPEVVHAVGISDAALEAAAREQLQEIERRQRLYRGDRERVRVEGMNAIVVDDGVATGASMRAALRGVRRWRPRRLVLAVPVAAADTLEVLRTEVDEAVCLSAPRDFWAVGAHYQDFRQTSDEEVIDLLGRAWREAGEGDSDAGAAGPG